jgi:cysteine-rich repeat protein
MDAMTPRHSTLNRLCDAKHLVFALLLVHACDPSPSTGGASGTAGASGASGTAGAFDGRTLTRPGTNNFIIQLPSDAGDAGAGGSDTGGNTGGTGTGTAGTGGSAGSPIAQCTPASPSGTPPTVAVCGDGFRTLGEACDDGNTSASDACSAQCQVTPELVSPRAAPASGAAPLASRTIGAGRHPLAAGCNTVAVAFADHTTEPPSLLLSTFSSAGVPQATLPIANLKVSDPNPAVAVLPGDALAVAWTDFDDDELGISLRKIVPGASTQSTAIVANEDSAFSQSDPDIVFDGSELVVAWVDSRDPTTSPDVRYRLFAPDLTPLTGDQTLAATAAVEDNVVLAGRGGNWAAAWRAGSGGLESIEVQSGAVHWTVGPFQPGAAADRPDLIFLDDAHLAVAFTMGTDPDNTGVANVPRLHAAVLDRATPGLTESFELAPAQNPWATLPWIGQSEPSLLLAPDHLLVAWRSDALLDDSRGAELWSRRVPFSVSGNTITLDPSHIEVPIVQRPAFRDFDQDAFRMVGTTLWPSGGIASVWDDTGRTFGAISGGTDVALQVLPDFPEQPPPSTSFRVSADGKYYFVNLLRRNYPPPTANATFAGGAAQYTVYEPGWAINGDDSPFLWSAPSAADPDAVATLTIDMGQYFSVGAVRPVYSNTPALQRIRLATTPGNWTTVLQTTPAAIAYDQTFSFDATPARYLELTMSGTAAYSVVLLEELFVYPSAQRSPPPSTADGYDLGYLSTTTANSNAYTPNPTLWPAGDIFGRIPTQTYPPYATGDAVATVDLGAQYPVSKLSLGFYVGSNWVTGGRLEVAAVPGAYSTIYDSGRGKVFGALLTQTEDFSFAEQLVRYIRVSDYFVPGVGVSGGILQSVQAFSTPAPRVAYYPLSADSKYFNVNLLQRPTGDIQPSASVVFVDGAIPSWSPQSVIAGNAIDGDDNSFVLWTNWAPDPSASATLTVDLGRVESIGAVRQIYVYPPVSSSIRVAETLAGPWMQVLVDTPAVGGESTTSFDETSARYVELTMKGTPAAGFANLAELQVFPSSASDPAPSSGSHLELGYLTGMTSSWNANMGIAGGYQIHSASPYGYYVKNTAQGATGDATVTLDLGQQYQVSELALSWFYGQTWPAGGKVDVDDGSGNWLTVFDSGRGTPLGSAADGPQRIPFAPHLTRHVRLTGYFDPAAVQGLLLSIEVF